MEFFFNGLIPRGKKVLALLAALVLFWFPVNTLPAQEMDEYAVKAAFTLNFVRFTQWPDIAFSSDTDPYQICYMGNSAVARQFDTLNGTKNENRSNSVRRLTSPDQCQTCDIVFVSRDIDLATSKEIILATSGKPILTIGETKGFTSLGGVINFFSKGDRLQFEINPTAAKAQGLTLSSRLLNLAVIVDGKEE